MKVIPIDNKGTQAEDQLSRREKVLLDPPTYRDVDDAGVDLETGKMV